MVTPEDPWTVNASDRGDLQLHSHSASSPSSGEASYYLIISLLTHTLIPADNLAVLLNHPAIRQLFVAYRMRLRIARSSPYRWYSSYLDAYVETITPDPSIFDGGRVPDGEIAVSYLSRTKNSGPKTDTIPVTCLASEAPTGRGKTFTLIRGDHIGTVHTTEEAPRKRSTIRTREGKVFPRADACELKPI